MNEMSASPTADVAAAASAIARRQTICGSVCRCSRWCSPRSGWSPAIGCKAFDTGAPPVEKLTFERTVLDADGIHL